MSFPSPTELERTSQGEHDLAQVRSQATLPFRHPQSAGPADQVAPTVGLARKGEPQGTTEHHSSPRFSTKVLGHVEWNVLHIPQGAMCTSDPTLQY